MYTALRSVFVSDCMTHFSRITPAPDGFTVQLLHHEKSHQSSTKRLPTEETNLWRDTEQFLCMCVCVSFLCHCPTTS